MRTPTDFAVNRLPAGDESPFLLLEIPHGQDSESWWGKRGRGNRSRATTKRRGKVVGWPGERLKSLDRGEANPVQILVLL